MSDTENGGGDKRPAAAAEDSDSEDDMLGRASKYGITAVSLSKPVRGFFADNNCERWYLYRIKFILVKKGHFTC